MAKPIDSDKDLEEDRAVAAALQFLARPSASETDGFAGPDAAWLWRRALLDRKQAEAAQAERPFRVMQAVSTAAALVALSVLPAVLYLSPTSAFEIVLFAAAALFVGYPLVVGT